MARARNADEANHGRSKAQAPARVPRFNSFEFVNVDLNDKQAKELKAQPAWSEEWSDALDRFLEQGYKVTIKSEARTGGFAAFASAESEDSDNAGLVLTGRGSVAIKAVRQVLYKHFSVLAEVWRKEGEGSGFDFDD